MPATSLPLSVTRPVKKLSSDQKVALVAMLEGELLEERLAVERDRPLPPGTKAMLDRRWSDYKAGKVKALSLAELKKSLGLVSTKTDE